MPRVPRAGGRHFGEEVPKDGFEAAERGLTMQARHHRFGLRFNLTTLGVRMRAVVSVAVLSAVVLAATVIAAPPVAAQEASDETAWCDIYGEVVLRLLEAGVDVTRLAECPLDVADDELDALILGLERVAEGAGENCTAHPSDSNNTPLAGLEPFAPIVDGSGYFQCQAGVPYLHFEICFVYRGVLPPQGDPPPGIGRVACESWTHDHKKRQVEDGSVWFYCAPGYWQVEVHGWWGPNFDEDRKFSRPRYHDCGTGE